MNTFFSTMTTKPLTYYKGMRMKADLGEHEQIAEIIEVYFPKDARILDFGCGEGALSQRLKDKGYDVYSVDADKESFKADTPFECLDFNDKFAVEKFYERHTDEFDLVLGVEVIEHLENPWEYVRNLKALTKIGRAHV